MGHSAQIQYHIGGQLGELKRGQAWSAARYHPGLADWLCQQQAPPGVVALLEGQVQAAQVSGRKGKGQPFRRWVESQAVQASRQLNLRQVNVRAQAARRLPCQGSPIQQDQRTGRSAPGSQGLHREGGSLIGLEWQCVR